MDGPHDGQSNVARYLITAVVIVLAIGYGMALLVTKDHWSGSADDKATAVTFRAESPDGSAPTPADLDTTRDVLQRRVDALGLHGATVAVDGDSVTVTAPGDGADIGRIAAVRGQFDLRPLLHALPAVPVPPTNSPPSNAADERQLRQSTDGTMQVLALQFHSSRCGQPDGLAGADDPDLPLITCARDGTEVFLLDDAIATDAQFTDATAVPAGGDYLVEFESTATTPPGGDGALAAVLDTAVVGAAEVQEGVVRISGLSGEQNARELAAVIAGGMSPLALTVEESAPATLTGGSTAVRVGMLVAGALVTAAVLGVVLYLVATRRRFRPLT